MSLLDTTREFLQLKLLLELLEDHLAEEELHIMQMLQTKHLLMVLKMLLFHCESGFGVGIKNV